MAFRCRVLRPYRRPMTFIVRRARPDEYEHIGQLTLAGFGHLEPGSALPEEERVALLLDAAGRDRQGVLLVAEGTDGRLLGEGAAFAAAWGAERLVLDTAQHNLRSQRLYLRFGFRHRPERDVHRQPPKVPLAVFTLDLQNHARSAAPSNISSALGQTVRVD